MCPDKLEKSHIVFDQLGEQRIAQKPRSSADFKLCDLDTTLHCLAKCAAVIHMQSMSAEVMRRALFAVLQEKASGNFIQQSEGS